MNAMLQSSMFWAVLVVSVVALGLVVNQILRRFVNRFASEGEHYAHRVANELPRTLHKIDHDEVLELKDQRSWRPNDSSPGN